MIGTEAATGEEAPDLGPDPDPATAEETVEEVVTAGDTLAQHPETDVAAADQTPALAAVAVTTEEEADLLTKREAPHQRIEETTLSPQVTTSESDL